MKDIFFSVLTSQLVRSLAVRWVVDGEAAEVGILHGGDRHMGPPWCGGCLYERVLLQWGPSDWSG